MDAPPKDAPARDARPGPLLDRRVRWQAGRALLGIAGVMVLVAFARPLAPGARPWVRLAVTLVLGLGVAASALLSSLRGRGTAEPIAFYGFLLLSIDALGQMITPAGWPVWPALALLVGAASVAEPLALSLGLAALATSMAVADAAAGGFVAWRAVVGAAAGYTALALAINRALRGEKQRLSATLAELARLRHGIDHLDDTASPREAGRLDPTAGLRPVSGEGRRQRQLDRAAELDESLAEIVRTTRRALAAHAVVYFDVDRTRDGAYARAADGPPELLGDSVAPLGADPFAFVLDRGQAFYATDFRRLLWSLPWYRGEVKVGTLLAIPVRVAETIAGLLVADSLEGQAFVGSAPEVMEGFAGVIARAVLQARTAQEREEMGVEFRAVYAVSRNLTTLSRPTHVRQVLMRSVRDMVPFDAAAVVMVDEAQTRYVVEEGHGWAHEFEGREVGLSERTWTAWLLRSAQEPYLIDRLEGRDESMPLLVLDEGLGRAESLLAVPLRARDRNLGALVLTGHRGAFDAAAHRVLGVLANQAAAVLATIQLVERNKERAMRDALTGLYNRRAFDEFLAQALAREERRQGSMALVSLDIDHFKKLNDTYGHPAGDAALRNTAHLFERHLRKGDQAARLGGEEFAALLPGTDEAGALQLAERVRKAVEESQVVFEGARLSVTVSLGIAIWPEAGREPEAFVAAADRALYAAKTGGRNRAVAASTLVTAPAVVSHES